MRQTIDTQQAYQNWAASYDTDDNPMVYLVEQALAAAVCPAPVSVVELGCGTGRNLAYLEAHGAVRLVGIDFSERMLAQARTTCRAAGLLCQDIREPLPLSSRSADLVVISLVLEHIKEVGDVFREAERVLAPGGTLLIFEIHPEIFAKGSRATFTAEDGEKRWMSAFVHDETELDAAAKAAGLPAGEFSSRAPDDDLAKALPKVRKYGEVPWLLVGRWVKPAETSPQTLKIPSEHRRKHFAFFREMNHPHFGITAPVEVTEWVKETRSRGLRLTSSLVYLLARAANEVPEFRHRIRGDQILEHPVVHPSFAIAAVGEDVFGFCDVPFHPDFSTFVQRSDAQIERSGQEPSMEDAQDRDDYLYLSPFPWASFTSVTHPMVYHPHDSVPRIAWGKLYTQDERLYLPLAVQAHHAVVDGMHLGRLYQRIEKIAALPRAFMKNR